tara:strand:- start:943 stop:5469 length:4527 start_codon:yes stop_codon:yes gene_type:complete
MKQYAHPVSCQIESLEDRTLLTATFPEFVDPHPSADNGFGDSVVPLSTGNVVITAPWDDTGGANAGAVYLYNGVTGELISTLTGSTDDDRLGNEGITALASGNFVISSSYWDNGSINDAGAVTLGNGDTGVSGTVSAANSLVGTDHQDYLGRVNNDGTGGVTALSNGNYVVSNPNWDNGTQQDAGAVTFGNGTTGVTGVISTNNSLVGSSHYDSVGASGVTLLTNGNYIVSSPAWDLVFVDNGGREDLIKNVGAVTLGNSSTGVTGVITSENSLLGSQRDDYVGGMYLGYSGVQTLSNGNYVVSSPYWNNGEASQAGAVTFGNGTTGSTGFVSADNSLVGFSTNDRVGCIEFYNGVSWESSITVLSSGSYIISSPYWDNGSVNNAGAVTFGNGSTGVSGVISASNSLVGSTANDEVGGWEHGGLTSITELANGNFVISSPTWDNGAAADAGAVTFGDGTIGVSGVLSATNSLVGSTNDEQVGLLDYYGHSFITTLANGSYVVSSPFWDNDGAADAGAVTFGDGTTGIAGVISASNSLVGTTSDDRLGFVDSFGVSAVTPLSNGNYVVSSPYWDKDTIIDTGAFTFGNGTIGVSGQITAANSLVGSADYDQLGYMEQYATSAVTALTNGNYVVSSPKWDNGSLYDTGASTFGNGTTGISGVISAANSLIGVLSTDQIGYAGTTALTNGNYVICSPSWTNPNGTFGTAYSAGAVTFGNGTTGITGQVSIDNSLVGLNVDDTVGWLDDINGSSRVTALSNGNYVVSSPKWGNELKSGAGAVTFGDGTTGVSGAVSAENSLIGSSQFDTLGWVDDDGTLSVRELANGNYIVTSSLWDNGEIEDAGAVTFADGTTGVAGEISAANSLVGTTQYEYLGYQYEGYQGFSGLYLTTILDNGNYLVSTPWWDNGAISDVGAVTFGNGTTGATGSLAPENSIAGSIEGSEISTIVLDEVNNAFYVVYLNEGKVRAGSQGTGVPQTTLDEISNLTLDENASEQTVNLTGITPGSSASSPLRVTATSNNPGLIADPVVSYTSPNSTGSLTFTPAANQSGVATITVIVEDGGLDGDMQTTRDNDTTQRIFKVIVNYSGEPIPVVIDLRVVNSPTTTQQDGEATTLPANLNRVDEWSSYWLEVWVITDDASSQGIDSVSLNLNYQTAYTTGTSIEYGAGFTSLQMESINDQSGIIENLAAETNAVDLGISDYLLFARIRFESLDEDSVDLDLENQRIGPHDLGFDVNDPEIMLVAEYPVITDSQSPSGTGIWANPYDLNDDDKINYRDLIRLVGVYGTIPTESDSDYAWAADLNQSNRVDYRDLILFVGNYGKGKVDDTNVNYPANYPDAWNQQLHVSTLPLAEKKTSLLTQSQADEALQNAINDVSPEFSAESQQQLASVNIEVVDLSGTALGQVKSNTIYLDMNAAGYGWFVDETPWDHSEFQHDSNLSLIALPGHEAEILVDLWTVIRHELGHLLAHEHVGDGIMEATLDLGTRKLPDWNGAADDFFASLKEEAELLSF